MNRRSQETAIIVHSGFTLIEVILAIVVCSLALVPAVQVFSQLFGISHRQVDMHQRIELAQSLLHQTLGMHVLSIRDALEARVLTDFELHVGDETKTFKIPVGPPDAAFKGQEIRVDATSAKYFCKVEVRKFGFGVYIPATNSFDRTQSRFFYGICGYQNPGDASVSTYTRGYLTQETPMFICVSITSPEGPADVKTVLTSCRADLGK